MFLYSVLVTQILLLFLLLIMTHYITGHNANFVTKLALNGHSGSNEDNLVWIFPEYPHLLGLMATIVEVKCTE